MKLQSRRHFACLLLLLALSSASQLNCPAARVAAADKPAGAPMSVAQISGTLRFTGTLVRVAAIDRPWADVLKTSEPAPKDPFLYEGSFDPKTGAFTIPGLLAGRAYDLVIWTESPTHEKIRWEGVAMDYHRPILPDQPAAPDDQKWLENFVKEMPSFYDQARVLHMAADHRHATLLVELARTRDFHSQKKDGGGGEIIYRVELWYFENLFGGWAKDKNTEKVLVRVRTPGDKLEKFWQFLPQLGGIIAAPAPDPAKSGPLRITLPEQATPANGLAGKTP